MACGCAGSKTTPQSGSGAKAGSQLPATAAPGYTWNGPRGRDQSGK